VEDPVAYVLITAMVIFPIALLVYFLVEVMQVVFVNQSLFLSYPFP
jgi:hypothetical protein